MNDLEKEINNIRWWHSIDLGNGVVTPGKCPPGKLKRLGMPERLDGLTVLDIGAWDGLFSFEVEKRGATRVLATDWCSWLPDHPWAGKQGFELARCVLKSGVEDKTISVYDIEEVGTFDLVLFLGVLYHLRYPMLALEKIFNVTKTQLILETASVLNDLDIPVMSIKPRGDFGWLPNHLAMELMLKEVGFSRVERIFPSIDRRPHKQQRLTFHAWQN